MNRVEITDLYTQRYSTLQQLAQTIALDLKEILQGTSHVDGTAARAKSIDRFVDKALKIKETGELKYDQPFEQIQDQVGARILVFYLSDVDIVAQRIRDNYRPIEEQEKRDERPEQFSYQARHFICRIPPDIRDTVDTPIDFFELQISTLFQHAWAEANHDVAYKPEHPLGYADKRKLAWAAAQAWGADTIFDELFRAQQEQSPN